MQETQEKPVQSLNWEDALGGRNGNPLQYSYLESFVDRGAWWANSLWGCKEPDMTEWHCEEWGWRAGQRPGPGGLLWPEPWRSYLACGSWGDMEGLLAGMCPADIWCCESSLGQWWRERDEVSWERAGQDRCSACADALLSQRCLEGRSWFVAGPDFRGPRHIGR